MLIYTCTAAQFAAVPSFGVHFSMCVTVRTERAYGSFCTTGLLMALRKNQPLVPHHFLG